MKRTHRLTALAAALLLLLALLAGCGASSGVTADSASDSASAPSSNEMAAADSGFSTEVAEETTDAAASESDAPAEDGGETAAQSDLTEKLIYSADLMVETTRFDEAVSAVNDLVERMGGFLENSNVTGSTRYGSDGSVRLVDRFATYTLRVPAARFQEALSQAGDIGNVVQSGTQLDNVTTQFIDQEARQASLEVEEQRLLELAAQSPDVETLVALEARLSEVRYEIEAIERSLRDLQNQVDYSTIRLSLYEVATYTPTASVQRTFGQRMGDALRNGWSGFVDGAEDFAVFLASALPALILLAAVAVAATLLIRRHLRRRRDRNAPPEPPQDREGPA